MFIPDIKNLVTKMQCKSVNRNTKFINDGESRIKKQDKSVIVEPQVLTNMSAYINKCSGEHCGQSEGVFNCDIHRSMNKSTISLSNVCGPHKSSSKSLIAIGSGRSYKPNPQNN